jgi:Flp pilus assembly CpaF family ATPase
MSASRSILDLPDEEALTTGRPTLAREVALRDPALLQAARDALLAALDPEARRRYLDPFSPVAERSAAVIAALRGAITEHRRNGGPLAAAPDDADALLELFAATLGWGPAQRYLDDPRINEVKINNTTILVQEQGRPFVVAPERFARSEDVRRRAVQLAGALGVQLDASRPQETLPVAHGTRIHATIHPRVAEPDGALVCIRRGRREAWDLDDLLGRGSLDAPTAELLRLLCRAGCSFLIAGRTGSGKTGLLEALANSWPGAPHIITIEDHTLEIGIREGATWTRELVDVQRDPQAFGRAAREALRQTPGLLLPGETRGGEAGAILALALSGHPVMTTLHARTAAEAVARFASYAAQPGAYMYEGRRDDALLDTYAAFDVVVLTDLFEATGRRLVAEVALLDDSHGKPTLLPLIEAEIGADGSAAWRAHITASDGKLVWATGEDQTPSQLARRLARARAQETARVALTRGGVQDALERAGRLLAANEPLRALRVLDATWTERRDERLLTAAVRALDLAPATFTELRATNTARRAEIERLVARRQWTAAWTAYSNLTTTLDAAAAAIPPQGWAALEQAIRAGLTHEAACAAACAMAEADLRRGATRAALDRLNAIDEAQLAPEVARVLLRVREDALGALLEQGEATPEGLRVVRERRAALERDLSTYPETGGAA